MVEAEVQETLWQHVQALAGGIGPRPAGSEAEEAAHRYTVEQARACGAEVAVEPFATAPTFSWMWLAVAALLFLAGLAPWLHLPAWAGVLVAVLGGVGFWGIASQNLAVWRLLPQVRSRNVICRIAPRGQVRRRVVLVAHVDSTRSALMFSPAAARHFSLSFAVNMAAAALAVVVAAGWWLAPGPLWRWVAIPALLPLGYGLFVLAHREIACEWVQGANDNASGVAVTLGLMEHFSRQRLQHTEVWAVFTGAEEVGFPVGARHLRDRYLAELQEAEIIVVDNVGQGSLRYLTGEGTFRFHRADPDLLALAQATCAGCPDWQGGPSRVALGSYTDAHPFLAAGLRTVAVWAEKDGVIPNWHWPTDVLARVDPTALVRAWLFGQTLIHNLEAQAEARVRGSAKRTLP